MKILNNQDNKYNLLQSYEVEIVSWLKGVQILGGYWPNVDSLVVSCNSKLRNDLEVFPENVDIEDKSSTTTPESWTVGSSTWASTSVLGSEAELSLLTL